MGEQEQIKKLLRRYQGPEVRFIYSDLFTIKFKIIYGDGESGPRFHRLMVHILVFGYDF